MKSPPVSVGSLRAIVLRRAYAYPRACTRGRERDGSHRRTGDGRRLRWYARPTDRGGPHGTLGAVRRWGRSGPRSRRRRAGRSARRPARADRPARARARPPRRLHVPPPRGRAAAARRAGRRAEARDLPGRMSLAPPAYRGQRLTNADLGLAGCTTYEVAPRLGLVGMLAGWWQVKISSGCPLAGPARVAGGRSAIS